MHSRLESTGEREREEEEEGSGVGGEEEGRVLEAQIYRTREA